HLLSLSQWVVGRPCTFSAGLGSPGVCTLAWIIFPPWVVHGRVAISHSPSSSVKRSPIWSCMSRTGDVGVGAGVGRSRSLLGFFAGRSALSLEVAHLFVLVPQRHRAVA